MSNPLARETSPDTAVSVAAQWTTFAGSDYSVVKTGVDYHDPYGADLFYGFVGQGNHAEFRLSLDPYYGSRQISTLVPFDRAPGDPKVGDDCKIHLQTTISVGVVTPPPAPRMGSVRCRSTGRTPTGAGGAAPGRSRVPSCT